MDKHNTPTPDTHPADPDPLEQVKRIRQKQLRACALKQKAELEQLLDQSIPSTDTDSPTDGH